MELLLIGTNHRKAPAEVRDALFMPAEQIGGLWPLLGLGEGPVVESTVLSTCNRTELYGMARDVADADRILRRAVTDLKSVPHMQDEAFTYRVTGREAVLHLFRVAAGLDSLMIGEPQILGQVKDALGFAEQGGAAGAMMTRLFQAAVHAGKRARAETRIGEGAVSVAYAAVGMATKVFADLTRHRVLVIGAGETGTLAATHFADLAPARLTVINRTHEKAQELAGRLGGRAETWDRLSEALVEADVVVTATSAPDPVLPLGLLKTTMRERGRRSLVLVDIASPRDVDPAAAGLDNVFLYDLDALQSIVEQNRARRQKEIPKAERIVEEEADHFLEWYDSLQVTPVVRALRAAFDAVGQQEAARQARHFADTDAEQVMKYTRSLINKLLHHPTIRIKELDPDTPAGLARLEALTDLFELDPTRFTNGNGGTPGPSGVDGDAKGTEETR